MLDTGGDRGVMVLIHGLWFRASVWTPWLRELDEAGYDTMVLSWRDGQQLRDARKQVCALPRAPIVIGHGTGAVVAERLLTEGDAAAAISLAPVPGGSQAIRAAARLTRREAGLALLCARGGTVAPTQGQFRRMMANAGSDTDASDRYERHVSPAAAREALRHEGRHRLPARTGRPRRGPLLLAVGGRDELIGEMSTASRYRRYRRYQPDAVTDYKVFPGLDHTLGLGKQGMGVLFYCLDWLTAQNM
ncbi:MAG TPA: alpha/beta hydrolase [Trebonia sp.]